MKKALTWPNFLIVLLAYSHTFAAGEPGLLLATVPGHVVQGKFVASGRYMFKVSKGILGCTASIGEINNKTGKFQKNGEYDYTICYSTKSAKPTGNISNHVEVISSSIEKISFVVANLFEIKEGILEKSTFIILLRQN